jgi:ribosomal protein S18 acetylase RimI-like enzyme
MTNHARNGIDQNDLPVREPKVRRAIRRPAIRRLRSDDARAYRAVLIEALILHSDSFREDYRVEVAHSLSDVGDELERSGVFGAWIDNKLVGIGGYTRHSDSKCRHRGSVSRVYVKQQFRRNGIASLLLQEIIQYAANYVDQLEAEVTVKSENVISIFERYGFRMCGLSLRGIRVDQEELDVWTLVRLLR